jgi:cytoskeleton protein RodZ
LNQPETEPSAEGVGDAAKVPTPHPAQAPTSCELPGRCLREAREARGLTLADAANALKFSPRQIEALEADDYAALKGATFVRGFVRSYARFLKLDADRLLALLDQGTSLPTAEVRPPEDTGAAMPQPGERRLSAWVAAAIALAVVAASLIAWHLVSPESIPALPRELPVARTEPSPEQPAVQPPQVKIEAAAPVAASGTPNVPAAAPDVAVLPPDQRQLVLTFSDKSWVEIKDSSQRVILSGEFPGGTRQVAAGKPPFQLWVGRASAVRVQDGDREIDLKPHARDEVARLTVD